MRAIRLGMAAGVMALGLSGLASAMMADPGSEAPEQMQQAFQLIMDKKYAEAIPVIQSKLLENNSNADAWNFLGFAYRKTQQFDLAWDAYERALALDPNHLRAHEYIGELYIQQGNMEGAREQLAKLQKLCPSGCMELSDMEKAIAKAE